MRRFSAVAPLIVGLSLCVLTCQRAAQPGGDTVRADAANGTQTGAASQQSLDVARI